MKLIFNKIEIYNYLSYENETFDFSKHRGMNLICGKNNDIKDSKNGTGKSSLLSALVFALFGQTPNKIKNENIPNRVLSISEPCLVTLFFNIDAIEYKIETGLSSKYRNSHCHIYKKNSNGDFIDLTKSSVIETHRFVETEILKCDMSVFLRSIYLSSDQTYNFFKLKSNQKKEFIEHLFDLSIFGKIYTAIHKDILKLEGEIMSIEGIIMTLNNSLEKYKDKQSDYSTEISNKKSAILANINSHAIEYKTLTDSIPALDEKISTYLGLEAKLLSADTIYKNKISAATSKASTLKVAIDKLVYINAENTKSIARHVQFIDKLCSECKPEFDAHYNISETTTKIKDNTANIESITATLASIDSELSEYLLQHKKINAEITKYIELKHISQNEKSEITLSSNILKNKILMLKNSMTELTSDSNIYKELIDDTEVKLAEKDKIYSDNLTKLNYLRYAENIVSQDTLRKFIIKDLVVLLNNQIKIYLSKIGTKFICEFDENMEYKFITDSGYAEYDNFSSGEKMRLAIATSFAFRDFMATRSNITSNILILDEYIDSNLDTLAINGLINILREFVAMYNQNIYIVSHRKEIDNSIFNNIILIEKTNGISKIKYEYSADTTGSK